MRKVVTAKGKEKRRGLLEHSSPPDFDLFIKTPIIHTFGMKFPIYLAWTRKGRIVKIQKAVPNRIYCYWASGCLETTSFEGLERGIQVQR